MKTSTIHQAGNKDFNPADYDFVRCFDTHEDLENKYFLDCAHCGKRIRYVAELKKITTDEVITVGETCLDSRFGITRAEFDALREQGKLNAQRATLNERKAQFIAEFPVMQEIINRKNDNHILADLALKFDMYAELSTKQLELGKKLFAQVDEYNARKAVRDAADAELIAQGVEIPTGRVLVDGKVLSTKFEETEFGYSAKMLVQDKAGWKVWCSIPGYRDLVNGTNVRFSVDITPKDKLFGFGKRPTKFVAEIQEGVWE